MAISNQTHLSAHLPSPSYPSFDEQLQKAEKELAEAKAKVEKLRGQILSSSKEDTPTSGLKRRAEGDLYPKENKRPKVISEAAPLMLKSNPLLNRYPHLAPILQVVEIEVPQQDRPSLYFTVPQECFIKTFRRTYGPLLASDSRLKDNKIVWVKKDAQNKTTSYYHEEAITHLLHFTICSTLGDDTYHQQYKKLTERNDPKVIDEMLQDLLDLAQLHEIEAIKQECTEFIAKRVAGDPAALIYYCGFVCQSVQLEKVWKQALFYGSWTAEQKHAMAQDLIDLLKEDFDAPQFKLISRALAFLLTKEVIQKLSFEHLNELGESLALLEIDSLAYPASLIAQEHPDASPLFSLLADLYYADGKTPMGKEDFKEGPHLISMLFIGAYRHLLHNDYAQSLSLLTRLFKGPLSRPQIALAYRLKAESLFKMGQFQQASTEIGQAIKQQFQDAKAFILQAGIHVALNQADEALNCLEQASLIDHQHADIWIHFFQSLNPQLTESFLDGFQKEDSNNPFILVGVATLKYQSNKLDEALNLLGKVLELDGPNQDQVLKMRSKIYALQGKGDETFQDLNKAIEINPNDSFLLAFRGDRYRLKGQVDLALNDLNQALQIDSNNSSALTARGIIYRKPNQLDLALNDLNRALQLDSNNQTALAYRGDNYRKQNQLDLALNDLNQAMQIKLTNSSDLSNPRGEYRWLNNLNFLKNSDIFVAKRGEIHLLKGNYDSAFADLNQAIQLYPNHSFAFSRRGELYRLMNQTSLALADLDKAIQQDLNNGFALARRGEIRRAQNLLDSALVDFDQAIRINPHDDFSLTGRGEVYRLRNQLDLALNDLNQALTVNPHNGFALARRGEVYRLIHRIDLALADLNEAIQIDPNDGFALARRAAIHQQRNQLTLALADLDNAISINSNDCFALALRGEIHRMAGASDLAFEDLNRALAIDPTHGRTLVGRGAIYLLRGERDAALIDLNHAVAANPQDDFALATRGAIHQSGGQLGLALQDFNRLIEIKPNATVALINRGEIYRQLNRLDLALFDLCKALQINPHNGFALARRGEVYRQLNQLELALTDINNALAQNPNDRFALNIKMEIERLLPKSG